MITIKRLSLLLCVLLPLLLWQGAAFSQMLPSGTAGLPTGTNTGPSLSTAPSSSTSTGSVSAPSGGGPNNIPGLIGLTSNYMTTGIGAGFLGTILGAETFSRINFEIGGQTQAGGGGGSFAGSENPAFKSLLQFGAYLGAALTSILVIFHGVIMVFNKMEYGDVMGEARERFIGFIRAALAFGLVMPIAAGGLSSAQYAVGYVAVASNGIGNRAAETVMLAGFGAPNSPLNMFNVNHQTSPETSAQVFADMVGQHSCLSYMKTINATPSETRKMCAASAIGSEDEEEEGFDVGYDSNGVSRMTDEEFCSNKHKGAFGGAGSKNTAFMRNACTGIRHAQRMAYEEIRDLYDSYDGNIESAEAQAELERIAGDMQGVVSSKVGEINNAISDEAGDGSGGDYAGGTYLANEMGGFINEAGWPGLGLIYSTIGSQMDAVSGLQSMNGTPSAGYSLDRLKEAGRQANSAIRIAQSDATRGAAASVSTSPSADTSGQGSMLGRGLGAIGDFIDSAAEGINEGGQWLMQLLFKPAFEDPGPAATYKIGSTVLGGVMIVAIGADFISMLPAGRVLGGAADFGKAIQTGLSKISSKGQAGDGGWFDGGSIILNLLIIYISALLMLTLLVATFLVLILPKIPVFLVAFLALEWAIWCAIVIFGAPLWVALNMTVIGNQPGIFTQRALSGLGVLLYILLFPAMVVAGVVISVLAYNLIIPVLSMMLLLAFGGGLVEMILGIFAMPFIMLVTLMIGAFVAITAISRIPHMITNYLGVSAPGGSVSESINNFIASPTSFNNTSNPQGMMKSGGAAMMGKGKGGSK